MKVELTVRLNCNFYVGQNVWCLEHGWTKVKRITDTILLEVGSHFWLDGKKDKRDKHPSLFDRDILNGTQPPCEFKYGDIVMVADDLEVTSFAPAFFKEQATSIVGDYKCFAGPLGCSTCYYWKYCISVEEYKQRLKLSTPETRGFF